MQGVTRGYIGTALGQLHYQRQGDGPALVLLPQSGRSISMFDGLIAHLVSNFEVIAIDLPGSGNSPPLADSTTIPEIGDAVLECLRALTGGRAHFYGIHTGNKVAATLAARWPDVVDRLVFAGQSHSIIPDQVTRNQAVLSHMHDQLHNDAGIGAAVAKWAKAFQNVTSIWWDAALLPDLAAADTRARAIRRAVDELQTMEDKARLYEANLAYDLGADLARIIARTLVLEIATPAETQAHGLQSEVVAALIRGEATTVRIDERDGFALTLEDRAAEVAEIIASFLST